MRIGVIGTNSCSKEIGRLAYEVGREIAQRGGSLICGGLGGVMEQACAGAKSAGGLTIGILPGLSASEANHYVDIPIVTGMGYARNVIVALSSQAIIAVSGRYGTLSEIAYALNFGKPVIGLRTWKLEQADYELPPIIGVTTASEAVEAAYKHGN
ncbi:MAG: TIGR00725 family protein [bacterium]|nr:TIGR00725 family protein [bacterium]